MKVCEKCSECCDQMRDKEIMRAQDLVEKDEISLEEFSKLVIKANNICEEFQDIPF